MLVSQQYVVSWSRRYVFLVGSFYLLVAAGCGTPPTAGDDPGAVRRTATEGFWVMGYHPWWMSDAWKGYDLSTLRKVMFFNVEIGPDGAPEQTNGWPDRWAGLAAAVHAAGGSLVPTVSILDGEAFVSVFSDAQAVRVLRDGLVQLSRSPGVDGIHLDFESFTPVTPAVREAYTHFVVDLRRALDGVDPRLFLSVYTLALDAYDAYDEQALADVADYLVVQGYDLHWMDDREAGPIAALDGWDGRSWTSIVDRYRRLGVPDAKIVMAVPYFGYEWPTASDLPGAPTRGPGLRTTYAPVQAGPSEVPLPSARERAAQYGSRRDAVSGSPYYVFQDSTGWHQGWFEDAVSLRAKYEYVKREHLGGVAIFPLGYGDTSLASALREAFTGVPLK